MIAVSSSTIASSLSRAVGTAAPAEGDARVTAGTKVTPLEPTKPAAPEKASAKPNAQASAKAVSKSELASQVLDLQAKMDKLNPALAFVLDQNSGRAVIQLTDRTTKEIIQQFPSAAAIQISKALDRFENGKLLNKTA
jgi:flagellar protein FlaG